MTTWLAAAGGRKHAENITNLSNAHAERLAYQERQQKRLDDTYVGLMEMVVKSGHWASRIYPFMDTEPPAEVPALPSTDEQIRIQALVRAYGSPEVNTLLDDYIELINEMLTTAGIIRWAQADREAGRRGEGELEARREIQQKHRPAELGKRREIAKRVGEELRGIPRAA